MYIYIYMNVRSAGAGGENGGLPLNEARTRTQLAIRNILRDPGPSSTSTKFNCEAMARKF